MDNLAGLRIVYDEHVHIGYEPPRFQWKAPRVTMSTAQYPYARILKVPRSGLSFYVHADCAPLPSEMTATLAQLFEQDYPVAGMRTSNVLADMDIQWKPPLAVAQRDELQSLGLNYVGLIGHGMGPVIWGQDFIDSKGQSYPLPRALDTVTMVHLAIDLAERIHAEYLTSATPRQKASALSAIMHVIANRHSQFPFDWAITGTGNTLTLCQNSRAYAWPTSEGALNVQFTEDRWFVSGWGIFNKVMDFSNLLYPDDPLKDVYLKS